MGDCFLRKEPSKEGCSPPLVKLMKDQKSITRVACINPPSLMPAVWDISSITRKEKIDFLSLLPGFSLSPACEDLHQEREWGLFLEFLRKYKRVAIAKLELYELYILPPDEDSKFGCATVLYQLKEPKLRPSQKFDGLRIVAAEISSPPGSLAAIGSNRLGNSVGPIRSFERNYVTAHPSYLKTLGQAHSSWIFGAIAELVDNSRDAKATKLEVAISMIYSRTASKDIPMLSVIDDGHGMSHSDIQRMVSFGHGQPETDDPDHIGRYGIGFKTGAMRLGKDALVLTQTANSRSIAFLSQSLNEGRDNLEIPIVSYRRTGQYMEVDASVHNEDFAKYNLKTIKKFSPFDKYLIGEKAGIFSAEGTGTQIYIWNLDKWGSTYSLQWEAGMTGGSSFHQGGIFIRSRRIRSRLGQISQMVPLDYSLKSYLEVMFLDPRMKIYVQGALVKSRPLAKSLNNTIVKDGPVLGKPVQLTLGLSQLEWEQANCGMFLYWHGRLIEAYKRVGSMIHNGDCGRGIIGVIDVTDLMDDSNGHVWVHNNKQGFQDCEAYAELERWLGEKADEYLDEYVDKIQLRKGNVKYKPDHEWVQCDKCRKWRMLGSDFGSKTLPLEWFCYMKPFNGRCEMPEEEVEKGLITISTKRHGYNTKDPNESRNRLPEQASSELEGSSDDGTRNESKQNDIQLSHKRPRRRLTRSCKKS
ncbi:MORC family CW-type zinc finger protein 2A-like isoform X2 [Sesamum indicum]|uniref:MORC family CW-type zinc finger protein 2A-like isoform X2 n=1 Tax=Sesamum indicum TaxID=4182 RepID=A0A8M8UVS3_SESIN|nr:MORC family CW-type zinc finger protein 2A-like isoform X2 [Sesamum indicum]